MEQLPSTLFVSISNIATVHLNTNIAVKVFIILIALCGIEVNIVSKCYKRNKQAFNTHADYIIKLGGTFKANECFLRF